MTTIAAVTTDEGVLFGADTCVSIEESRITMQIAKPKIWRIGNALVGFRGALDVLESARSLAVDFKKPDGEDQEFTYVHSIADAIKTCIKEKVPIGAESSECLIGYKNMIYVLGLSANGGLLSPPTGESWAIGSGQAYALGSLYSTPNETPVARLSMALNAAAEFDYRVKAPFNFLYLPCENTGSYDEKELPLNSLFPEESQLKEQVSSKYRARTKVLSYAR